MKWLTPPPMRTGFHFRSQSRRKYGRIFNRMPIRINDQNLQREQLWFLFSCLFRFLTDYVERHQKTQPQQNWDRDTNIHRFILLFFSPSFRHPCQQKLGQDVAVVLI